MIRESAPWKTHLIRDAALIEHWCAKPRSSERRSFLLERKVFLAAYAMRKLDEALKVSTDLLASEMMVLRFPPTRAGFNLFNNHRFDEHFDLDAPENVALPRRRVLNLLVHSLVFVEVLGAAETCDAFMVTSDQERERGLLQVQFADFIGLMRLVGGDWPASVHLIRDADGSGWRVWAGHGKAPEVAQVGRKVR
ncbi:hypothetical protein [Bosea sp. (in: a-proteobacteria)]|uniref:hypothetical protein n=1 Tax=Bosea sp. (in: a-proteobacteria) TaxID=1871050 RepID=UPI001AC9A862|nr:hypothetical protein [Bosea sp. (in: a-proteobacteria)]MBN9439896.1 hypothetical protein [Bosea sp. (in: a-proteobacteria)]